MEIEGKAHPVLIPYSHGCPLRERDRVTWKGGSMTYFWHKAIIIELKIFKSDYQRERIKKYLLGYVIQSSKSYTILFHCQHFNFTASLGPQLKPGGRTPEVKAGQHI